MSEVQKFKKKIIRFWFLVAVLIGSGVGVGSAVGVVLFKLINGVCV